MKPECIEAVNKAVGRELSGSEIKAIEDRLTRHMKQNAAKDPNWQSLSRDERARVSAQTALAEFAAEKQKAIQQKNLSLIKQAESVKRMTELKPKHKYMAGALGDFLLQVDTYYKGMVKQNFTRIMDTINSAEPRFFGLMENPAAVRDFVYEVHGIKTGNEVAAKGAKAWLDGVEAMRKRFNDAGGDIRKLDYGYLPQPHDVVRIIRAKKEGWVNTTKDLLDKSKYIREDGSRMDDDEIKAFLEAAYDTLSTGGLNKFEPGKSFGGGKLANRGNDARQIHFNGPDAYLKYMKEFGRGSVFDAMQGHVSGMSRDIALVEQMGPNPNQTFKLLNDTAIKNDGEEKFFGAFKSTAMRAATGIFTETRATEMWDVLSGKAFQSVHAKFAEINQGIRNFTVATKLQGTLLSSMTDLSTMLSAANYNNISKMKLMVNTLKSFGKDYTDYANVHGMIADSVVSDMNRVAEGNIGQGWTGKLANTTMKVSLMNAWTNALRRGFSISLMNSFAKMSQKEWGSLDPSDLTRLKEKGITEQDWEIFRKAEPEDWRGSKMLTPESLSKVEGSDKAVTKLLGFIADESEYAVLAPDLMARAIMTRGTQKGTVNGELLRHFMLFKGFPTAMLTRWGRRTDQSDKPLTGAFALIGSLTTMGALSIMLKDIAAGKDPRDMTQPKFWGAAFIQGGGFGVYGDILYTGMGGNTRGGQENWMNLMGPVAGTGFDAIKMTLGNVSEAARGEETNLGAESIRFARQNLPFLNLWYARAALDHMFIHELQESASPGYLYKMKQNTYKDWGQEYWWEPGGGMPQRAPDFSKAVGE